MEAIQMSLNLEEDSKFSIMQKQLDSMHESMGKVRRKVFSEVGEMKKLLSYLKEENEALKIQLSELNEHRSTKKWFYTQSDLLFDFKEA